MRIVKRLRLLSLTPLVIVIAVSFVAWFTSKRLEDALLRNGVAEAMVGEVFDLGILTYDYLSYYEDRPRIQWVHKHKRLAEAIADAESMDIDTGIARKMKSIHAELGRTFAELSDYHARRGGGTESPIFREWETHLATKLLIRRQQAFSLARDFEAQTQAAIQRQYGRLFASTALAFFALSLFLGTSAYRTGMTVARGLRRLQEGAASMAQGRLDFRIDAAGEDELSELARAFNQLSASLTASYVSIARLQGEITQRQKAEAALTESERRLTARTADLEALNAELEEFSYSMSHDMRTPLRAIDGFTELLAREYEGRLDAEALRLLNVVRDNTRRLSQIIEDILTYTRTGRRPMTLELIDMEALVRSVWAETATDPARHLQFVVNPLPKAEGDYGMLRQTVTNLLHNAVKFTRPTAEARIEVGAQTTETEHIYYVKDNGVGFDQRFAGKLFGTFQRLHGVQEFEGTGIGLAIVKRIIMRHGGRVWAAGQVGGGATFSFTLPVRQDEHG